MSKNVTIIQCRVLTQTLVLIRCQILFLILILSNSVFTNLVIFVSIHDSVKKLFMSQCHKKINTFDVLTFIQMRTVSKITTKFLTR